MTAAYWKLEGNSPRYAYENHEMDDRWRIRWFVLTANRTRLQWQRRSREQYPLPLEWNRQLADNSITDADVRALLRYPHLDTLLDSIACEESLT